MINIFIRYNRTVKQIVLNNLEWLVFTSTTVAMFIWLIWNRYRINHTLGSLSLFRGSPPTVQNDYDLVMADANVLSFLILALMVYALVQSLSSKTLKQFAWRLALYYISLLPIYMSVPFHTDQGYFGLVAKGLLSGKLLFKEYYTLSVSTMPYLYWLIFKIIGVNTWGVALVNLVATYITSILLAVLGHRFLTLRSGLIAGVIFSILLYFREAPLQVMNAQAENFIALFLLLSILFISMPKPKLSTNLLAGVMFTIAVGLKPFSVVFLPIVLLTAIRSSWQPQHKIGLENQEIKSVLEIMSIPMMTGALIAFALVVKGGISGLTTTAISDYKYMGSLLNAGMAFLTPKFLFGELLKHFSNEYPIYLLTLASLVAIAISRELNRRIFFIIGLYLSGIIFAFLQMKFFCYHFLLVFPFLSLIAAYGIESLSHFLKNSVYQTVAIAGLIFIFFFISVFSHKNIDRLKITCASIEAGVEVEFDRFHQMQKDIAKFADKWTTENDQIFVWALYYPLIYYWSDRLPNERLQYFGGIGSIVADYSPTSWKDEMTSNLIKSKPKLMIVAKNDPLPAVTGTNLNAQQYLELYPKVKKMIASDYELFASNNIIEIYRRRY